MPGLFVFTLLAVLFQSAIPGTVPAVAVIDGRCFSQEIGPAETAPTVWCLAGVRAPGRVDLPAESAGLADAARAALAAAITGRRLEMRPVGAPDRWGRQAALVFAGDEEPVQIRLLEAGHVHIVPTELPQQAGEAMRAAQLAAQITGRGIWADPALRVLYTDNAGEGLGEMRFVRGRILYVHEGRDWTYLNFGPDWRTDFTVQVKPRLARRLKQAGLDLTALEGKRIEIYGLVHDENGPAVELTDGADIRVIPETE